MKLFELKPLHDAGFSLIYLQPRDKRPVENAWTTRKNKTWKELKNQFRSEYNLGVRLGEHSAIGDMGFLCCIDVDIKDAAYRKVALERLKQITGDTFYPEVRSGSGNGSKHLYALSKEPFKMVEIEKHKGKWEICAYSTGRQMVLPPSVHPSGKAYRWKTELHTDLLPIFNPEKYQQKRKEKSQQKSSNSLFKACEVDITKLDSFTIDQIRDGKNVVDRSADLLSIAMKMCRASYTDDEILSALSDERNWISEAAFDHTGCRDRARAVKWLRKYTLEKARFATHPLRMFEQAEDFTQLGKLKPKKAEELKQELVSEPPTLDKDGNGKPKNSLKNVVTVLERFMGGGLVGFNEFACRPFFLKDTPYGGKKGQELQDNDDLALKHFLSVHYRFEPSKELCYEAHCLIAQKYRFHPIKRYLEKTEWDGCPRLDSWLSEAFRAGGPIEYTQAVGRKCLVAAVARIYEPGCKFDYMTVLEGNQGEGKSISLGMLVGPQWFTDSLGDIHNKDVVDQMIGKWLIEVSELDSIRGREAEAVKAFVSRQVDRVRLSYMRRAQDYPRQCIFIGSTNDEEYLTDETGNRRYWPIKVGEANREWLKENRDQLWAEARYRYELGEKLYLTRDLEAIAKREQEKRFEVDVWESEIKKIVDKAQEKIFQTIELYRAITMSNGTPSLAENKRIGKIMHRLRYVRSVKRFEGVLGKCWVKR